MLKVGGSSHFARRYSGNLGWFLFLWLLRCFSSPGSPHLTYVFSQGWPLRVGFPHSDISGSKFVCQLPEAFRRLPRPSSPVIAKASTTCTYSLDPITLRAFKIITFLKTIDYRLFIHCIRLRTQCIRLQSNPIIHILRKNFHHIDQRLLRIQNILLLPNF